VLQSVEDPTRFILHEWYVDGAGSLRPDAVDVIQKGRPKPARRYGTIENEANPTP
jgi:hypothetical protein